MKKTLLAAVVAFGLVGGACAFGEAVSGVLIDSKCGDGKTEEQAAKHPKACTIKCEKSGYVVVSGKKSLKFDDKGNKLAKEYLAKEDNGTKVVIKGEVKGDEIAVESIEASK
jgi:hypothetical protein